MSKYRIKKITANIEVLKPLVTDKLPLGYKYINHAYPNILLLAKKNSGKTNIIYNLLKRCANASTEVIIFCPTVDLDSTYKMIIDYLDSKNIPHQQFKNLDNLETLLLSYDPKNKLIDVKDDSEDDSEEEPFTPTDCLSQIEVKEKPTKEKKRPLPKSKFIVPEHIFIFDDLKEKMRNKVFNELIATNRHYNAKVIISTHSITDLLPGARSCLDVMCLFPKIPIDSLYKLFEDVELSTDHNEVIDLYKQATEHDHNFLYVDIRRELYSFNFDKKIIKND